MRPTLILHTHPQAARHPHEAGEIFAAISTAAVASLPAWQKRGAVPQCGGQQRLL